VIQRRKLYEAIQPNLKEFRQLTSVWGPDASTNLLSYVWHGCDALRTKTFQQTGGMDKSILSLERGITQLLVPEIRQAIPLASPYDVEHGPYEFESLAGPSAQPPAYDIGFVPRANAYKHHIWPIEAKVLETDGTLSEYVNEVRDNFLTCRYAPFSAQGAMLGYLLKGAPAVFYRKLSSQLQCPLPHHPDFPERNHKTSDHQRSVPEGKTYPSNFRCHHLVLEVGPAHVAPKAKLP
jgi:hypothetical protein